MSAVEELSRLLSVLHDGTISSVKGTEENLTLRIDCHYLAELFQSGFYFFYVELANVSEVFFTTWEEPVLVATGVAAAFAEILRNDLEIVGARVEQGYASIDCLQPNPVGASIGGTLTIHCEQTALYDQEKKPVSLEALQHAARRYWESIG